MPTQFARPCLTCRKLTRNGPRCPEHTREKRALYGGIYPVIARAWIRTHPQCVKCGHRGSPDNPLTADHVEPGSMRKGLQTLCRRCNSRKGDRAA